MAIDPYRAEFFRNLDVEELEPANPFYVNFWRDGEEDPVAQMRFTIDSKPGDRTAQLLSGYRGAGKSTELRRLKHDLTEAGKFVVLADMEAYLHTSSPIAVGDFLLALMGALSDTLASDDLLGANPGRESYWVRFSNFVTKTAVDVTEVSAKLGIGEGADLSVKANLKNDPSFRAQMQAYLANRIGAFIEDARQYVRDCVAALRARHGDTAELVLLVDSMEHYRGTSANAAEVHDSVERLFAADADKLQLPDVHVVYTVPPWLKVAYQGVDAYYRPGGLVTLTAHKVHDQQGHRSEPGIVALREAVAKRAPEGNWKKLLGTEAALDQLILMSGGHPRDLFRLVQAVLRSTQARPLPVGDADLTYAIEGVRAGMLPIPRSEMQWLQKISRSHTVELEDRHKLHDLSRFFDTHLVLVYRNGREWYDVHPLVRETVLGAAS